VIREFKESDTPVLANLMIELGYPTTCLEMMERLQNIHANPDYKTLVAESSHKVIGMMGMLKIYFWEQNKCYVKIQALVVKKETRKHGVGELLVKGAEKWAKQINATSLALTCGNKPERNDAHFFYLKRGFINKSVGYIKPV